MNLPNEHSPPPTWRLVIQYMACYIVWLALGAFGFWLLLALRINLFDLATYLRLNPWQVRAVGQSALYLLGLVWFAGLFVLEAYLRNGVVRGQLWSRIGRVSLVMLITAAVSYSLRWLAG
jgi:hypothetical protein